APLHVLPRRGFVLVTEPLPRMVHHKVYAADYVADVASDSAALQTSPVVEGTAAGPVLIGASRERVGFDRSFSLPVLRALAAGATRLFP
ncbi:FAD-dependent oxidoreductase, partial [Xylella fastidiosa subsp. multiplex]|nr:FAD-dependent oxidoreductase [Xylella fastidiosa subsp. multiplex]